MEKLDLEKGLKLNEFSENNIKLILQLKEIASELGFEYSEYDAMDGFIFVTFALKKD